MLTQLVSSFTRNEINYNFTLAPSYALNQDILLPPVIIFHALVLNSFICFIIHQDLFVLIFSAIVSSLVAGWKEAMKPWKMLKNGIHNGFPLSTLLPLLCYVTISGALSASHTPRHNSSITGNYSLKSLNLLCSTIRKLNFNPRISQCRLITWFHLHLNLSPLPFPGFSLKLNHEWLESWRILLDSFFSLNNPRFNIPRYTHVRIVRMLNLCLLVRRAGNFIKCSLNI